MQQYHVYGLGAALVDTEITVTDQNLVDLGVDKGLMTLVDQQRQQQLIDYLSDHLIAARRASGGSAANTIIASSYFGASAFYSCKVAADDNGAFYLQDLRAAGVDYHHNGALEDGITGKCLVMITPDAERSMNTFLGISEALSVNELHEDAVKASQYAYIEGYLVTSDSGRAAAIRLREVAEENGVKTAISLSDPAIVEFFRDGLQEMAGSGVDLLFCNKAEALGFTATDSLAAAVGIAQSGGEKLCHYPRRRRCACLRRQPTDRDRCPCSRGDRQQRRRRYVRRRLPLCHYPRLQRQAGRPAGQLRLLGGGIPIRPAPAAAAARGDPPAYSAGLGPRGSAAATAWQCRSPARSRHPRRAAIPAALRSPHTRLRS